MGSLSGLVIGLSFVIGFILMGVVAELYYLLCWRKRFPYKNSTSSPLEEDDDSCFVFAWKRPNINPSFNDDPRESEGEERVMVDLEMMGSAKDLGLKANYGEEGGGGIEAEIMRMHNLCGPPRFLFTIKEESREDLESVIVEDNDGNGNSNSGKGSVRTKRLSDLFLLSSPPTHAINTQLCLPDGINNPLFECATEAEMSGGLRPPPPSSSSPPPKFKFLKDAEDKLMKKLLVQEAERRRYHEEKNDLVNRASQVLPLPSIETSC